MFCPNCGKELRPGGKFCTSCGWKLPESVLVKTSGGGSYTMRSIVDHVEDRTGLREKIEALN